MREECGIEIYAHAMCLCKICPLFEVLRLELVSVGKFAVFKNGIAGMNIQLLLAGAEGHSLFHIGEQLIGSARLAGVVARGLNTAGERSVMVEARHIVALPTVQGNRHAFKSFHSGFDIHAALAIHFFCIFKNCVHIFSNLLYR